MVNHQTQAPLGTRQRMVAQLLSVLEVCVVIVEN